MFDNEISADIQMRKYEELSRSPAVSILSSDGADLMIKIAKLDPGIIGAIAKTHEIVNKFFQMGTASLSENLEHLSVATQLQMARAEAKLASHGVHLEEIDRRTSGPELRKGIAAAILQSQRTTQETRFKRMALLLGERVTG